MGRWMVLNKSIVSCIRAHDTVGTSALWPSAPLLMSTFSPSPVVSASVALGGEEDMPTC